MGVKMNFRIITKNHAADQKIRNRPKIDFRADGTHEFQPTAWELNVFVSFFTLIKAIFFTRCDFHIAEEINF